MSNDNLLRLLALFDASEEAQALINALRNAGHIVRETFAASPEAMRTSIEENPLDLVLVRPRLADMDAATALRIIAESGRDIPLVVITDAGDHGSAVPLLRAGARDAVPLDQPERLTHIVSREMLDLRERRTHRRCEAMLHETEKRARALIDNSRDAIAYVHDGMHIYANSTYLKMFGFADADDVQGAPIMDMVSAEDHSKFKDFLRNYSKGDIADNSLDVMGQTMESRKFKITMEFSPASMEGEACTQIIIRDQTLSKELEKKLNVLSKQDLLTGLYNRTYFLEQLDKITHKAAAGAARGALLYIGFDAYQSVKENMGLSGSDLYLADVAAVLNDKVKDHGLLARFDGPIFTLLLPNFDQGQAEKVATGMCKLVADHISDLSGKTVTGTTSIGISIINETTPSGQEIISRAEKACEIAANAGGNRAHVHNPAVADMAEQERLAVWGGRIKDALRQNRFRLVYQPIVSLHGAPGENYEVLVRMIGEDGEEIPPQDFLPAAEHMRLLHFVDRWVIANALKVLSEQRAAGKDQTRLFVKLTGPSITDESLLPWLIERIKALRLDADMLVFQINEQTALNHLNQTREVVSALREFNCRIVLEGFGTESNTFNALKHLEVHYLKVHGSLVANLAQSVENQERVKAIAEQARQLGKQTIATFVEDAGSLAILWQCSIDFIQGNFLQEPKPTLDFDFDSAG